MHFYAWDIMADVTIASNAAGADGKWVPYYYKQFQLGLSDDGTGSTDGNTYITQTVGADGPNINGSVTSSYNCNFYYIMVVVAPSTSPYVYFEKYDLNDNRIDTIYASDTTGDGRYWKLEAGQEFTFDVGVSIWIYNVLVGSGSNRFENGDKWKITLPSADTMIRRRIYHGGYSTFIRLPYEEGVAYHTDTIPTSLKENIGILINPITGGPNTTDPIGLVSCMSLEDLSGNKALSVSFAFSADISRTPTNNAGSTIYAPGSGEYWQLGTVFAADLDPGSGGGTSFPLLGSAPLSDVKSVATSTGAIQSHNALVSGKAGYCRIRSEYWTGTGSTTIQAHNQFWPTILFINK